MSVSAAVFFVLGRQRRRDGLYIGLFFALYGPVRFVPDALRVVDALFDILFDFPPPPGDDASGFTDGESIVYDLT